MRLYHQPRSRSTRVLWLLEELGAPYELTVISREEKASDAYRRLHPLGRSPVMEEDEGAVFESAAICLHVADLHPDAGLLAPPGTHERALHYQWAFYGMTELEAPLVEVGRQLWKESGEPDRSIVDAAIGRFATAVEPVVASLGGAGGGYLVADRFSVADVIVGSVLLFARTAGLTELPAGVLAYVDALEARPARQRAVAVAVPA